MAAAGGEATRIGIDIGISGRRGLNASRYLAFIGHRRNQLLVRIRCKLGLRLRLRLRSRCCSCHGTFVLDICNFQFCAVEFCCDCLESVRRF